MPGIEDRRKLQGKRSIALLPGRKPAERVIEGLLVLAALSSVGITVGIVGVLLYESSVFFQSVSIAEFLMDTQWTPLFADAHFGIWPLLAGTMTTTAVALALALPLGTVTAIYLSEYATAGLRETVKPFLELLTSVPTVIFGYFALLVVTPLLQLIWSDLPGFNMLSAGLVIGVMIIPYISSVSEDALHAVPGHLREGALALGATRMQTALGVVLPSAISGIAAGYVLGISRAMGETMVVAVAAGMQPTMTWNPFEPAATVTAYIVQVSLGDLPHGSVGYQTIFAAGLTLFVLTFLFNVGGYLLRRRYHRTY
jgi:phosphate transport system permease protein